MSFKFFHFFILFGSVFTFLVKSSPEKILIHATPTFAGGLELRLDDTVNLGVSPQQRVEIHSLLGSPQNLVTRNLKNNRNIGTCSLSQLPTPDFFYNNSKEVPAGLLTECTGYCHLNRLSQPWFRNSFEQEVVKAVSSNCIKEKLVYTSFGSGFLFSDFILITKLIEKGFKNIDINLIDLQYNEVFSILRDHKNGIATDHIFDKTHEQRGY